MKYAIFSAAGITGIAIYAAMMSAIQSLLGQTIPDITWIKVLEFWGPAAILLFGIYRSGVWISNKLFDEPNGLVVRLVASHIGFIEATSQRLEKIEEHQRKDLDMSNVKVEKMIAITQSNAAVLMKLEELQKAIEHLAVKIASEKEE